MKLAISGGVVVPGDGRTVIDDATVLVDGERIAGVERSAALPELEMARLDASDCVVLPGLINCHVHGVAPGPLFPSAAPAPPQEEWRASLDRHLLAGTTTVLSLCGFVPMEAIRAADSSHPVNVRGATGQTPSALRAARAADGSGLDPVTERLTVEEMLNDGAVAIGELGAGHTLGGGGQDARYLPDAFERATGIRIGPRHARSIKEAAVGRHISLREYSVAAMVNALERAGLGGSIGPEPARDLVVRTVLPSVNAAVQSLREGARLSARFGIPALFHTAAATHEVMLELAGRQAGDRAALIASHINHPSFTAGEAAELARFLAAAGWIIEADTFDLLEQRALVDTREQWDAVHAHPGLVDVIATDYGNGGYHDRLIAAVADLVDHGYATLAEAVAKVTSRVSDAIPGLAPNRGTLARGRIADITVARATDLRDVRHVLIGGQVVVRDGAIAAVAAA